jgi:hypothetical protein
MSMDRMDGTKCPRPNVWLYPMSNGNEAKDEDIAVSSNRLFSNRYRSFT